MKKLLSIIVLGLFLSGCSDNNSIKLLEKCANQKITKVSYTNEYTDKPLEEKLSDGNNPYLKYFKECEIELKNTPKTFKQLYR